MYIYEQPNWPHFSWDRQKIAEKLIALRHQQGKLFGGMGTIGFPMQTEVVLQNLTQDVIKSSEIEGEILDPEAVRSSVARHLGLEVAADPIDKNIEGVVEMVLDATIDFETPLNKERLFAWHKSLFPFGRSGFSKIRAGAWRKGVVQVVSGSRDREKIHFEAPTATQVDQEMELFLDWIEKSDSMDLVLKAAIAHLWFVTIHPFEDGNGRIGRAIADLILARSEKSSQRFYSLSSQIQKERKSYYDILEKTQKGSLDITAWIEWFLGCLSRAIEQAISVLGDTIHKSRIWGALSAVSLNDRQKNIIRHLLEGFKGNFTSSKWAKISKCSQDTAYRDILDLVQKGILVQSSEKGRSTHYLLAQEWR